MTDEEIEIKLKECYEKFWGKSAQQSFFKDTLDYINRLKIRVQELGACNIRILEREAGQIRKDTVKEILGLIEKNTLKVSEAVYRCRLDGDIDEVKVVNRRWLIHDIVKNCGVEVDDE